MEQNTIILMWNPSISSYTMGRFDEDFKYMVRGWFPSDFNWSVWDYNKAKKGDKFFMVKVGEGVNGIVMSGTFTSDPYQDEDWYGKGRKVFYMDMDIEYFIHPDRAPLLTSETLAKEIPDFIWTGGHSGQLISKEQAEKLKELWEKYLDENTIIFEPRAIKSE